MPRFDLDDFDPYAGAEPQREKRLGGDTLSLHQMQKIALPIDTRPGISDGSYR